MRRLSGFSGVIATFSICALQACNAPSTTFTNAFSSSKSAQTDSTPPNQVSVSVTTPVSGQQVNTVFTLQAQSLVCGGQPVVSMSFSIGAGAQSAPIGGTLINALVSASVGPHQTLRAMSLGNHGATCSTDVTIDVVSSQTHSPTPSPTPSHSASPSPSPTPSHSASPSPAPSHSASPSPSPSTISSGLPSSKHVWMITEENLSYEHIIGSSSCPYINGLANKYGLATTSYSEQHSSLPALMWLVAGAGSSVTTNNDIDPTSMSACFKQETVVRPLLSAGYKWRAYMEGLPSPGYQPLFGGPGNNYYRRHNPLIDFTDACVGSGQENNSVPLTQMATDFANGYTTNYAYISPSAIDDMHSGTPAAADAWLAKYVPTILARPEFQAGGDGVLFITFDEGDLYDDNSSSPSKPSGGGGHIVQLVIGPQVKPHYRSTTVYHNASILATTCALMRLSSCPGAAATSPVMTEFFGPSTTSVGVTIDSPLTGAILINPVPVSATASEPSAIASMQIVANGKVIGTYSGSTVDQTLALPVGPDISITIRDLAANGTVLHSSTVTASISNSAPTTDGVTIYSPSNTAVNNGGALPNPVIFSAIAVEKESVNQMQIWDNGEKLGVVEGGSVNLSMSLAAGTHTTTIMAMDTKGTEIDHTTVSYTVASAKSNGTSITTPAPGSSVSGAVTVNAAAAEAVTVSETQVWDNGVKLGSYSGGAVSQSYDLEPGTHTLTVLTLDSSSNVIDHGTVIYSVDGGTASQ